MVDTHENKPASEGHKQHGGMEITVESKLIRNISSKSIKVTASFPWHPLDHIWTAISSFSPPVQIIMTVSWNKFHLLEMLNS